MNFKQKLNEHIKSFYDVNIVTVSFMEQYYRDVYFVSDYFYDAEKQTLIMYVLPRPFKTNNYSVVLDKVETLSSVLLKNITENNYKSISSLLEKGKNVHINYYTFDEERHKPLYKIEEIDFEKELKRK